MAKGKKEMLHGFEKKFRRVAKTPAGFALFEAIHDFVEYIELNSPLASSLSRQGAKDQKLLAKYAHLKKIYQGLQDVNTESNADLGHERYMTICDLKRIRNEETSDHNAFWKKREIFRRLASEMYEQLNPNLALEKK